MSAFAVYRLPYGKYATKVLQTDGEPAEYLSCAELNGKHGFVMAPFETTASHPILLIRPDEVERIGLRSEEGGVRSEKTPQIVIFGKKGHAEVLGLVGQTQSNAIVIENFDEVTRLDFTRDIYLYSQTTKSLDEYHRIIEYIQQHIAPGATFRSFDTICRSVANRMPNISQFAARHDLILFVCGRKSSNGKVLFNECLRVNPNTHLVEDAQEIESAWLEGIQSVGICGATSTPRWLMEQCRDAIQRLA